MHILHIYDLYILTQNKAFDIYDDNFFQDHGLSQQMGQMNLQVQSMLADLRHNIRYYVRYYYT